MKKQEMVQRIDNIKNELGISEQTSSSNTNGGVAFESSKYEILDKVNSINNETSSANSNLSDINTKVDDLVSQTGESSVSTDLDMLQKCMGGNITEKTFNIGKNDITGNTITIPIDRDKKILNLSYSISSSNGEEGKYLTAQQIEQMLNYTLNGYHIYGEKFSYTIDGSFPALASWDGNMTLKELLSKYFNNNSINFRLEEDRYGREGSVDDYDMHQFVVERIFLENTSSIYKDNIYVYYSEDGYQNGYSGTTVYGFSFPDVYTGNWDNSLWIPPRKFLLNGIIAKRESLLPTIIPSKRIGDYWKARNNTQIRLRVKNIGDYSFYPETSYKEYNNSSSITWFCDQYISDVTHTSYNNFDFWYYDDGYPYIITFKDSIKNKLDFNKNEIKSGTPPYLTNNISDSFSGFMLTNLNGISIGDVNLTPYIKPVNNSLNLSSTSTENIKYMDFTPLEESGELVFEFYGDDFYGKFKGGSNKTDSYDSSLNEFQLNVTIKYIEY